MIEVTLSGGSPDRFGYSWDTYGEILPAHETQFLRWTAALTADDWRGKHFLDAGCGIGRNSYWPLTYGAAGCLSVDIDERTLAKARENLAEFPQARVVKQSIYELDYSDQFDIAFSIGVIHHLSDPLAAVCRLKTAVKPGGLVLTWLYGRENNGRIVWMFDPLRRAIFSRVPLRFVHALSLPLTAALWAWLRILPLERSYLRLIRSFSFRHLRAIVFDQMIPRITRYYRHDEAIALFQSAGLTDVQAHWTNENSWSVTGTKPG